MATESENIYELLEADKGFQSKRRAVVISSALLITLIFSGASIVEANTFILKIEFKNSESFPALLSIACAFLLIRYYGYAQKYHEKLSLLWKNSTLKDYRVFWYDPDGEQFYGLLAEIAVNNDVYNYRFKEFIYEASFPLRRRLIVVHSETSPEHGDIVVRTPISLNKTSKVWSLADMLKLLRIELVHRWAVTLRTREYLDVYYPYALSAAAIALYFFNIRA